jgi:hypothetical protein
MAHEEVEIVRQHISFKERDHVLPDGTQRDRNREAAFKTTYSLMAHEETEVVRQHLCFKERDHVQADGT